MTPRAFKVHQSDNVATLLDDVQTESIDLRGADAVARLATREPIKRGHKVAVVAIAHGEPVLKFGVRIGHATRPIAAGDWVHLHNLASDLDARSSTLDIHSGAPTDTDSAYV